MCRRALCRLTEAVNTDEHYGGVCVFILMTLLLKMRLCVLNAPMCRFDRHNTL